MSLPLVEVVSAVIVRDQRILLTQRRASQDFPFTWECPGGKVDDSESHHDAIRRELLEELGIIVTIGDGARSIWTGEFKNVVVRPDRGHVFLLMYPVGIPSDAVPQPCEGQGIGWFTAQEMNHLTLAPGNERAFNSIRNYIESDTKVLCCTECERPLRELDEGGFYCDACKFAPSMQDTFLRRRKSIDEAVVDVMAAFGREAGAKEDK